MNKTLNNLGNKIAELSDKYDSEVKYNHYNPKQRKQLYSYLTRPKKPEYAKEATKEQIDYLKNNYNRMVTTNGSNKKPLKLSSDLVKDIKIDITPIPTVKRSDATKFFPQVSKPVKKPSSGLAYLLGVDDQ